MTTNDRKLLDLYQIDRWLRAEQRRRSRRAVKNPDERHDLQFDLDALARVRCIIQEDRVTNKS